MGGVSLSASVVPSDLIGLLLVTKAASGLEKIDAAQGTIPGFHSAPSGVR
jgi:hypothetical protein